MSKDTELDDSGQIYIGDEETLENTLGMLREFVHGHIKYEAFQDLDKQNLIEIFITHPTSLVKFYECIFPPPAQNT